MMGQLPGGIALAVEEVMRPRVDWKGITTTLRAAVSQRGLLLANAEPQVHGRRRVPAGASLGVDASPRRCRGFVRLDVKRSFRHSRRNCNRSSRSASRNRRSSSWRMQRCSVSIDLSGARRSISTSRGLGGTDFRPAFEHVDREQLDPACLIYLTDGDGAYPDEPSTYPTLWAITTPNRQAPWGETVYIDVTGP